MRFFYAMALSLLLEGTHGGVESMGYVVHLGAHGSAEIVLKFGRGEHKLSIYSVYAQVNTIIEHLNGVYVCWNSANRSLAWPHVALALTVGIFILATRSPLHPRYFINQQPY